MSLNPWGISLFAILCVIGRQTSAMEIVVDYRLDTENFFDTPDKRDALQAAADRYSRIITSSLAAVTPADSEVGWRIGFAHPGTGESYEISSAADRAHDPLSEPANEYGFPGLLQDQWMLFAGGYELASAGIGGTATGLNFQTTFDDLDGPLHRGLIPNTPSDTAGDLPVWGGAISFNTGVDWNFDLASNGEFGVLDFYTIALHEIGHALGLATSWNQAAQYVTGDYSEGPAAIRAYNQDNGTAVTRLDLESAVDLHWRDGAYDSFIFSAGQPVLQGTLGLSVRQDLLMEPAANFVFPNLTRFELTNVDVAALTDIGWSVIAAADLDINGDGVVDGSDVTLACASGQELTAYFDELNSLVGDLDFDGRVAFADFLRLSANFGQLGGYTDGDVSCDGLVSFADFLIVSANFGGSFDRRASSVPEPGGLALLWVALAGLAGFGADASSARKSRPFPPRPAHCRSVDVAI